MAEHIRIDEGIKRKPKKHPPKAARTGMFMPTVTPEQKQIILKATYEGLARGLNTNELGEHFGIPGRTIRYWLINDDNAHEARKALVDQELVRCGEEIRDAQEPLPLARAREEFRYWSWIAERRDAQRYGQKQELTITRVDLGDRLRRARERVIVDNSTETGDKLGESKHTGVMSNPPALPNPQAKHAYEPKDPKRS